MAPEFTFDVLDDNRPGHFSVLKALLGNIARSSGTISVSLETRRGDISTQKTEPKFGIIAMQAAISSNLGNEKGHFSSV
jgi:hypothetical protein